MFVYWRERDEDEDEDDGGDDDDDDDRTLFLCELSLKPTETMAIPANSPPCQVYSHQPRETFAAFNAVAGCGSDGSKQFWEVS